MTNGLLQLSGHLIGLIIQIVCAAVVAIDAVYTLVTFFAFSLTGAITCVFVRERLLRTEYAL